MQIISRNGRFLKELKHYGPPALTMGFPVAYIIGEHISWKRKKPDSMKRMIIQQASFWVAAIAGGILMHDTHFQRRSMSWKLPRFVLASALLIAGFSGGERLAQLLYPKKPATAPDNASFNAFLSSAQTAGPAKPEYLSPAGSVFAAPALTAANGPFKMR
jgi:hypothetical protein